MTPRTPARAIGILVATGRTSDVYEYGSGAVVKVSRPEVPSQWAEMEARYTSAVRTRGVDAPEVLDVVDVDGRAAIVFERIAGISMWERMRDSPGEAAALARELASIHTHILSSGLPSGVPGLVDRMLGKIAGLPQLSVAERDEAQQLVLQLPRGAALHHGDLHPGNVLMGASGPVVIDWFDAAVGHPIADVVRSSLLLRPMGVRGEPYHLPGATPEILAHVHDVYLSAMAAVMSTSGQVAGRWESVAAASRLAEGVEADEASLMALWNVRNGGGAPSLLQPLFQAGAA